MSYNIYRLIGAKLQCERTRKGIKQEYIAKQLKTNRTKISKIENGSVKISISVLLIYCKILELSLPELFTDIDKYF
ncbi:MAG: helix-turn-helix transcriptional regulator [Arachidicoccus sp.]|nr:helix-turn-helix transcriptional regulator [Arachidicoccus sp.]